MSGPMSVESIRTRMGASVRFIDLHGESLNGAAASSPSTPRREVDAHHDPAEEILADDLVHIGELGSLVVIVALLAAALSPHMSEIVSTRPIPRRKQLDVPHAARESSRRGVSRGHLRHRPRKVDGG
jgi:hypothetical protein